MSGSGASGTRKLDFIFYENYYRYMDDALAPGGEGLSIIQVLCVSLSGAKHSDSYSTHLLEYEVDWQIDV